MTEETSTNNINSIYSKISQLSSVFKQPKKNAINPFTQSKYADLSEIIESLKPALASVGLGFVQVPVTNTNENGQTSVGIKTIVFDKDNQVEFKAFSLPLLKTDPQSAGSALTYLRRYTLSAIFGIAADDDDGNQSSGRTQQSQQRQRPAQRQQRSQPAQRQQNSRPAQQQQPAKQTDSSPAGDKAKQLIKDLNAKYSKLINKDESESMEEQLNICKIKNPKNMTVKQARELYQSLKIFYNNAVKAGENFD
ncbi:hypothetical protein B808_1119 [Fructilactobacillus florum 8D]|uniref:Uncharacterized protein n=1 Tax=Fructilactobacillus florum 8D TaxID=1221538 RepID=W9EGA0_9LACO|nr:ERF family protein [Fructilactobacillus florum]ETO40010.1 hypothetical protein B808_1119 [Fructilactobacillus florum 8D]